MAERFEKEFASLGGQIQDKISIYDQISIDAKLIERVKKHSPEFILLPSYQIEAASIISKLVGHLSKDTIYIGPDSWVGGEIFVEF